MTITNFLLLLSIWGYIAYIAIIIPIIFSIFFFFRNKKTGTDLAKLQIERKIYAFGLIESIIFWYGTVFLYGNNNSPLTQLKHGYIGDYAEPSSYFFLGYFCIIGIIYFAILFLYKSNKIYGEDYINVRGLTSGVKYGLLLLIGSVIVSWSIFLVISKGDYNFIIFKNIWASPLVIQVVLFILSTIFIFNGTLYHKIDDLYSSNIRNIIFSIYIFSIVSLIRMANIMDVLSSDFFFILILCFITIVYIYNKIYKLGIFPTRFLVLIYIIFLIGFFLAAYARGIQHGRFLFFGFIRKPRKAIIKHGNSWLTKN